MSKRKARPDPDPNVAAYEVVARLTGLKGKPGKRDTSTKPKRKAGGGKAAPKRG